MLTRNIDKARDAYHSRDVESLRSSHDAGHEPHSGNSGKYIKSIVYGGLDGMFHGDGMPGDHGMQWSMAVST